MNSLVGDLRYGARLLVKSPGATAVALVTLALGIGVNTAIFSVVDAVVLRPLSFEEPDQLVVIYETWRGGGGPTSHPNFVDLREQNSTFADVALFRGLDLTLTGAAHPKRVEGARVSADFFRALRVQPALGRLFQAQDDLPGAENVVVVGAALWRNHFKGDPNVLGQVLTLDGTAFSVIGVLPEGFSFPVVVRDAELWTPLAADGDMLTGRDMHVALSLGRLKPGVTLAGAQAELDTIAARLAQEYPDANAGLGFRLGPLQELVVRSTRSAGLVLLGAAGLVLLIACANVANLLLARGAGRERELALRAALGAGRGRLIRQLLTESGLLAAIGGTVGLLLALWGTDALAALLPPGTPRTSEIAADARVLGFALLISVMTGLGVGLVPALSASRSNPHVALKEGGRVSGSMSRRRLRDSLVVSEVALAFVLLIGAGLMMRSFHRLTQVDPGFDPDHLLTFRMEKPLAGYSDTIARAQLYRDVTNRLESLPGVQAVGAATTLPLAGPSIGLSLEIEGRPDPPPGEESVTRADAVTCDYFRTMGIPLRKGRFFRKEDGRDAPGVAIVNEAMVRRYWPDADPIGQRIKPAVSFSDDDPEYFEIVGIVADVRASELDQTGSPGMYFPYQQQTWPFMSFVLRTTSHPRNLIESVRAEVAAVVQDEAAFGFETMSQYVTDSNGGRRFPMMLLGMAGLLALALAAMGIYAMLSYSVVQRTREIGIRMALGAQHDAILRWVLQRGARLIVTGLAIGLFASLGLARVLSSQLYETTPTDLATYLSVLAILSTVALSACYLPARRATRVDPMVALRCE